MKKTTVAKKATALALVFITMTACMISAFAYNTPTESDYKTVNGVRYKITTDLYLDGGRQYRGAVYVSTTDQSHVPAGTIFVQAELYDTKSTKAVSYSDWSYNKTADYWAYAITPNYYTDDYVRATGNVQINYGTTYESFTAPATRFAINGNRSQDMDNKLKLALDADGNYPKTINGETYGSGLSSSIVGYKPDLISAIGTNGVSGYIRNEDASPKLATVKDYEIYMAKLEAADRKIPLYDLQGNVIGDFEISKSEDVVPGAESPEVVREAIQQEMNKDRQPGLEETRDYFADQASPVSNLRLASLDEVREFEARAMKEWLVDGEFKKTADGKTYAPSGVAHMVGKTPDLIGVIGNNGMHGYITKEDQNPLRRCETRADIDKFIEYLSTHDERTVPVYDLEGNVVDEMTFYKSEKPFG